METYLKELSIFVKTSPKSYTLAARLRTILSTTWIRQLTGLKVAAHWNKVGIKTTRAYHRHPPTWFPTVGPISAQCSKTTWLKVPFFHKSALTREWPGTCHMQSSISLIPNKLKLHATQVSLTLSPLQMWFRCLDLWMLCLPYLFENLDLTRRATYS